MLWIILVLIFAIVVVVPIAKGKQNFAKNPEEEGEKFMRRHLMASVPGHARLVPSDVLRTIARQAYQVSRFVEGETAERDSSLSRRSSASLPRDRV